MIDDSLMLVDFQNLTKGRESLNTLQAIKQDLIGGEKQAYFDRGLMETILLFCDPQTDPDVLYECLVILNSFLIDFPPAIDVLKTFKSKLETNLEKFISTDHEKIVEIGLRITRNLIKHKILNTCKIEAGILNKIRDLDLVASLAPFSSKSDTEIVQRLAKVIQNPFKTSEQCLAQILTACS